MHIIKKISKSLVGTLLNTPGKTKDEVNVRKDIIEIEIRHDLAPSDEAKRIYFPPAQCTLTRKEKIYVLECLKSIKVLTCYSSNISRKVSTTDLKLIGMKSHDYYVLLTQLLPKNVERREEIFDPIKKAIYVVTDDAKIIYDLMMVMPLGRNHFLSTNKPSFWSDYSVSNLKNYYFNFIDIIEVFKRAKINVLIVKVWTKICIKHAKMLGCKYDFMFVDLKLIVCTNIRFHKTAVDKYIINIMSATPTGAPLVFPYNQEYIT